MGKGVQVVAVVLLLAAPVAGQEQRQASVPVETPTASPTARQMVTFEAVLIEAVRSGAAELLKLAGPNAPNLMLSDPVEATGFQLPEYGVLFHVRVPPVSPELSLLLRLQLIRNGQRLLPQTVGARPPGETGQQAPIQAPPVSPFIDRETQTDPDAVYTREVKSALIDAMLDYGPTLRIPAAGYLIIAARDNARRDPQMPSDQYDFETVEFRVKGADLLALQQGKITRDEARKLVTVRQY